ncbi:hypothetical protein BZA02_103309 [Ruegeria sp. P4]|nr:hypothetical protein BZA02_103309 [Ruegeria sp. P4]
MRQGRAKEIADLHASSEREVGQRLTFPPAKALLASSLLPGVRHGPWCLLPIPPWPRPGRDFLQQTANSHHRNIRRRDVNTADHPFQHPIRPIERR